MQLCGSSEIDFSSEPTVAGTMVSFVRMGWDGMGAEGKGCGNQDGKGRNKKKFYICCVIFCESKKHIIMRDLPRMGEGNRK